MSWDWIGDHAKPEWEPLEAILSPRLGAKTVRWFVEQRYAQRTYTLDEQLRIAVHPETNPSPAQLDGHWEGRITCGHNPFLMARLVEEFRVGADGVATWHEIPVPDLVKRAWAGDLPFDITYR
jgi:hypothetical protein